MNMAKNILALLGGVWVMLQIWSWVTEPKGDLEARVSMANIAYPPSVDEVISSIRESINQDAIEHALGRELIVTLDKTDISKEEIKLISSALAWELRDEFPRLELSEALRLTGMYKIEVRNNGSSSVSAVRLKIPNFDMVEIIRDDKPPEFQENRTLIQLGTIQPTESVILHSWSKMPVSSYRAEDIRLTHDKGIGSISIRSDVGGFALWVDEFGWLLLFVGPWAIFIACLVFYQLGVESEKTRQQNSDDKALDTSESEKDRDT